MKYRTILSLLLGICYATVAPAQVQPGTTLVYKVTKTLHQTDMDSASNTAIYRFRVLEQLPEGRWRVESTLLDYRSTRGNTHFDVARLGETPVNSSDELLQLALLHEPVEIVLGGNPPQQPELVKILQKKGSEWHIRKDHLQAMTSGLPYYLLQETNAIFFTYPKGQPTWQSKDSSILYSVSGAPGGIMHISARENPAKKTDGHLREYRYEYDWGDAGKKIRSANLQNKVAGTGLINGENKAFRVSDNMQLELLEAPFTPPVVPAQLKEMSVLFSFWSDGLNANGETDSAKLYAAIAKFDPLYGKQKRYVQAKLGSLQSLPGEESHYLYDDSLRAVPIYLLEGNSSHLHNRLQNAIGQDADSAMMLLTYLSKASRQSFRGWVQHSFAQELVRSEKYNIDDAVAHFRKIGWPEQRIERMIEESKGRERYAGMLIERTAHHPDTLIHHVTYPMYLYHEAKNLRHKDSLQYITNQFRDLPPAVFKEGNAGRYALLLYKKLQQSGHPAEAGKLLDNTIGRLEKTTADSTSNTRHAEQNILAYAYKLKYDTLKHTNRKQAFIYLAKAAAASPKSPEENVHDSFYDRALLGSKESYRQDFANELLKEGAGQEALMVLSQQISADPSVLPDVQKSFKQHLPEKDFAEFFEQSVMRSWKTAPAFELQGVDGKTYRLSDYAGKWLLLDFWGTWCHPCREELPQINAFANQVKNDPEKAFLSIACYDNAEKVNALFSQKGYTLPAALSDTKVQYDYHVRGYPSKFLVSPEGKMIFLNYGTDWRKIVELFSKVRPDEKNSTVSKELR